MSLLEEAIAAHGGAERFEAIEELAVRLRCGGVAMATRGHPRALASLEARVHTREPHVRFLNWPGPGQTGVFDGWHARIEGNGPPLTRSGRRHRWRWDHLDVLHFAGYALWNYMTLPFLLARPGIEVRELPGRRLEALFPPEIPTHSRRQIFWLDSEGRIARHDYTAEVFGNWAKAAHRHLEYERLAGLVVAIKRRVVPRGPRDVPLPGPTLVSIQIDRVEPTVSSGPSGAEAP